MPRLENDARTRWLLTLSVLGTACSPPPPPADAQDTDAAVQDVVAVDRPSVDVPPGTDTPGMDAPAVDVPVPVDVQGTDGTPPPPDVAGDADVGPYPAGPYGNMEGQTLEDLPLAGYLNAEGTALSTTLPFGPTSMQAIRRTGRRYALVHTSAFY